MIGSRRRANWYSPAEDGILRRMWVTGASNDEIAEALPGRSVDSFKLRASYLKLGKRRNVSVLLRDMPSIGQSDDEISVPIDDPLLSRLRKHHPELMQ